ncbi:MAG: hypothetical protein WD512_04360 [Candidatus Paceibacterota bacterium]
MSEQHLTNEEFKDICFKLSKRNNSTLYKIETYFGVSMMSDDEIAEIRNDILTVSAEIKRLPYMTEGD